MNFDYWVELYKKDKELFEKKKDEYIEAEITRLEGNNKERSNRLRAILWAENQKLKLIKNDTERFNVLVSNFWKQFAKFKSSLDDLKTNS